MERIVVVERGALRRSEGGALLRSPVALINGVNMWQLAQCNGIYNLNYILAFDTFCIPAP